MSLQDMKRQIQSVDNTAKMTGAMQTISAVKLSRARERLDRIRPYTDNMQQMMRDIASRAGGNNPLLVGREEVRNVAVCTVTSVARVEAQCLATYALPGGQITPARC